MLGITPCYSQSVFVIPLGYKASKKNKILMTTKEAFRPSSSSSQPAGNVRIASPYNNNLIEGKVVSILRSGKLVQGEVVKEFENALAGYIGCKHVVAVNSGTASLHVAFTSIRLKSDDPKRNQ